MVKSLTLVRSAPENLTLSDALESFVADAQARRLTDKTVAYYRFELSRFVAFCDRTALAEIDGPLIRRYLTTLTKRGLKGSTVHAAARALRAWFRWCVRESLLSDDPMRNVQMPKVERPILPALSVADVETLLAACESVRDRAIILCLLDSGCRAQEFVNLNIADVNKRTGEVTVRLGKGKKSRVTFFGPRSRKELMRYLYGRTVPDSAPLFVSDRGNHRLTVSGLAQILKRLGQVTGIHVSPHALRRTCALWCHRKGWRLTEIQRLLGHSDLTVLLRYLDLDSEDVHEAFEKAPPSGMLS